MGEQPAATVEGGGRGRLFGRCGRARSTPVRPPGDTGPATRIAGRHRRAGETAGGRRLARRDSAAAPRPTAARPAPRRRATAPAGAAGGAARSAGCRRRRPAQEELGRRAEVGQHAVPAPGPAGDAHPPAVQDEAQAERTPLGAGQQGVDVALDADRIAGLGEPEQSGQPGHVGVHRQAGKPEADAEDHVGRLAPHAGQGDEVLHGVRDLAPEALVEGGAQTHEAPGLGAEEPGGVDQRLQLGRIGVAEVGRRRVAGEHLGRDQVDLLVGGLRRQDVATSSWNGLCEVEGAQLLGRARVFASQAGGRLPGPALRSSWSGHGASG